MLREGQNAVQGWLIAAHASTSNIGEICLQNARAPTEIRQRIQHVIS
jgi:hypothetical protein